MPAEVLPTQPAPLPSSAPDQSGAPSLTAMAVQTGVQMAALLTPAQTEALAAFIGGILRPIVKEEVEEAFKLFKDKATISKGNDALQTQFPL